MALPFWLNRFIFLISWSVRTVNRSLPLSASRVSDHHLLRDPRLSGFFFFAYCISFGNKSGSYNSTDASITDLSVCDARRCKRREIWHSATVLKLQCLSEELTRIDKSALSVTIERINWRVCAVRSLIHVGRERNRLAWQCTLWSLVQPSGYAHAAAFWLWLGGRGGLIYFARSPLCVCVFSVIIKDLMQSSFTF